MGLSELPFRATTAQACQWLAQQTGSSWSLARLIEHKLTPSVWLDYDDGGFAAPLHLAGDTSRMTSAGEVFVTLVQDSRQVVSTLRFLKKDLERLARKLTHAQPQ